MPRRKLSSKIIEDLRRCPTKDVLDRLGVHVRRGSLISCPYRDDRNPSWSMFRNSSGVWLWHDFSTGRTGDNISLYREMDREKLSYPEAVDHLSYLMFGRSAYEDEVQAVARPEFRMSPVASSPAETSEGKPALSVTVDRPIDSEVPYRLADYWRRRGISDCVAAKYCRYVVIENANRKGRILYDHEAGLPIVAKDGTPLCDDGLTEAVGMTTDIGGMVFRAPDEDGRKGFKGATESFISTFLADGTRPAGCVTLEGQGDNRVLFVRYYAGNRALQFNASQWFSGITPEASIAAVNFLREFDTMVLSEKETRAVKAVLSSLCSGMNGAVDVGEGFFDIPLSTCEMRRMNGYDDTPGRDLVCLNGIGNIRWAVPFLSCHRVVNIYLDNDIKSHAGEKACEDLRRRIEAFAGRCGLSPVIRSCSGIFYPEKDLNDYLKKVKGFSR